LHPLTFTTGRAPWPAQLAEQPAWVRFTLSEREANKTLQFGGITHGDGRGYDVAFRTGETEDYLLRAAADPNAAPDLAVDVRGRIGRGAGANGSDRISFVIDYANVGSAPGGGGTLRFNKPAQLRDMEIVLLRAPNIPAQGVSETEERVTVQLPTLAPGAQGRILLAWDAPSDQTPAGDYTGTVAVTLSGDSDPANNQAATTLTRPTTPLRLAIEAGDGSLWGLAETTCRDFIRFPGQSAQGVLYDLVIDGAVDSAFIAGVSPWTRAHPDMPEGRHEIWFAPNGASDPQDRSNSVRLNVDTSLPIDPLSLTFTDSQGRSYHPPTYSWGSLGRSLELHLRDGETYEIAIDSCSANLNQRIDLILPSGDAISLTDDDDDGRYSGSFEFAASEPIARARLTQSEVTELQLAVRDGSMEQRFAMAVQSLVAGTVRNQSNGQPLADVSVTALAPGAGGAALLAAAAGGPNPQTTDADGRYAFTTLGGSLRLLATRTGYQPFRSWDIAAPDGLLAPALTLTPTIADAPDHTIYITANGFVPAVVPAAPDSVIEWVNLDTTERGVRGDAGDSGVLAPGASYRLQLTSAGGSFTFSDPSSAGSTVTIVTEGTAAEFRLFLPLIRR
jgi:hypothetical protein